jgi:hypothetical protein
LNRRIACRPKGNFAWATVAILLVGLYLAQVVFFPVENSINWIEFAIGAFAVIAAFLIWIRPKLVFNDDHLVVVNPLSKVTIAYKDIDDLDTKWSLRINHKGKKTRVWVAPANGKQRWISESTRIYKFNNIKSSEVVTNEFTSVSASLGSDSGVAAALIRERLKGLH